MKAIRTCLMLGLTAFALTACATTGGTDEAELGDVMIQVENAGAAAGAVTVWIVPEVGTRDMLGTVSAAGSETFTYSAETAGSRYRLVAEGTAGQVVSEDFIITSATESVTWDLGINSVTTR